MQRCPSSSELRDEYAAVIILRRESGISCIDETPRLQGLQNLPASVDRHDAFSAAVPRIPSPVHGWLDGYGSSPPNRTARGIHRGKHALSFVPLKETCLCQPQ